MLLMTLVELGVRWNYNSSLRGIISQSGRSAFDRRACKVPHLERPRQLLMQMGHITCRQQPSAQPRTPCTSRPVGTSQGCQFSYKVVHVCR